MKLCIDLGNTTVKLGLFVGDRLVKRIMIPTESINCDFTPFTDNLHDFLGAKLSLKQVGLVSVVPELENLLTKVLEQELQVPLKLYNKASQIPVKLEIDEPAEVGADRALGAWYAYEKYAKALIVIDFGTALTFDLVSASGEFEGGIIAPGITTSFQALTSTASQLPLIKTFEDVGPLIGRNTKDCLRSAYFHGTAAMVKGLIARIEEERKKKYTIIFTGGWINKELLETFAIDGEHAPNLLLEGLNCLLTRE